MFGPRPHNRVKGRWPSRRASIIWHLTTFVAVCARLCYGNGGVLEQIQFGLGHASVRTTERYIGWKQKLTDAVNDRLGITIASNAV